MSYVGTVAELFAGVGGFRLGLEGYPGEDRCPGSGWKVVWSNQWEPGPKVQHASDCYERKFGSDGHSNKDISQVLNSRKREDKIPPFDLLVGGFPCQDYSVAKTRSQAAGIVGKKGVLWWQIFKLLKRRKPPFVLLENVDRLLKSPTARPGRDFGVMLWCFAKLGYFVEWRIVNAADYGFPQRRRRVFIVAERRVREGRDPIDWIYHSGVLAAALPVEGVGGQEPLLLGPSAPHDFELFPNPVRVSKKFEASFENAGVMHRRKIWTRRVAALREPEVTLASVLEPEEDVPPEFLVDPGAVEEWQRQKGKKSVARAARNGFRYRYTEGAIAFPDRTDAPSRTILTGEGGRSPSRFKHIIPTKDGGFRRLMPVELERLNGFPDNWTKGLPAARRAFLMGNALVVGVVQRIGAELAARRRDAESRHHDDEVRAVI